MELIVALVLLLPLWVVSLRGASLFIVSNVAMLPVLATFDRLVGGVSWDYSAVRLPLFFSGLLYLFFLRRKWPIVSKRTLLLAMLITLFSVVTAASAGIRGSIMRWATDEYRDFGIMYMPLSLIVPMTRMNVDEAVLTIRRIVLYILVPSAAFGIYQYIVGPDAIERMGFTLVTPNTVGAYAEKFAEARRTNLDGMRVPSLLPAASSYAAMMFHGFLWSLALQVKSNRWPAGAVLLTLFSIALVTANFVTLVLFGVAAMAMLAFMNIRRRGGLRRNLSMVLFLGATVAALPVALPEVVNKILARTDVSFSSYGSIAGRYEMITNYPTYQQRAPAFGYGVEGMKHLPYRFSADQRVLYNALRYGPLASVCYMAVLGVVAGAALLRMRRSKYGSECWRLQFIASCTFGLAFVGEFGNGLIPQSGPSNIVFWFIGGLPFMPSPCKNTAVVVDGVNTT